MDNLRIISSAEINTLLEDRLPLTREDVRGGAFEVFCDVLHSYWLIEDRTRIEVREIASRAMGYRSHDDLCRSVPVNSRKGSLPLWLHDLCEPLGWRWFLTDHLPLVDCVAALHLALMGSRLSVRSLYDWAGQLIGGEEDAAKASDHQHRSTANLRTPFEASGCSFDRECLSSALDHEGMMLLSWRSGLAHAVANSFWTPECGRSAQEIAADIHRCARLPIEKAIVHAPYLDWDALPPPGLVPVRYLGCDGSVTGYGFRCKLFPGHLRWIYPPDGRNFMSAWIALWKRQAPPPSKVTVSGMLYIDSEIPHEVFYGVSHEAQLNTEAIRQPIADHETDDETDAGECAVCPRSFVRVTNGVVDCGFEFEAHGASYTRPRYEHTLKDFEGLVGFSAPVRPAPDPDPLRHLVPSALDSETYETMHRVFPAFDALRRRGIELFAGTSQEILSFVEWTCAVATPIRSRVIVDALSSDLGIGAALGHGHEVAVAYPGLQKVGTKHLGEYAFGFWHNAGVADSAWRHRDLLFSAYVSLRNLGLDPLAYARRHEQQWLAVLVLIFSQLSAQPDDDTRNKMLLRVLPEARILFARIGSLSALRNSIASSPDHRSRFFDDPNPNPEWSHWLDYHLNFHFMEDEWDRRGIRDFSAYEQLD